MQFLRLQLKFKIKSYFCRMMNKNELDFGLKRIRQLLLYPSKEWKSIREESTEKRILFRTFFIPFCLTTATAVLLVSLFRLDFFHALGYALINLTSSFAGIYLVYLLIREYLNGKSLSPDNTALVLTVYSSVIFLLFHSLSIALGSNFFGQLTGVISLIFLRTLYTGIYVTIDLTTHQKTNLFIITSLAIIFIPVIIHKLLMILFHIPAFNV